MDTKRQYVAFLSYSHADSSIAKMLHSALEKFQVPKDLAGEARFNRLQPIFRDKDELRASASLPDELRAAVRNSEYLIVLCSPSAATSDWVNSEIDEFAQHHSVENILPVILDGVPPDCFPESITQLLNEPYAPHLNDSKAGLKDTTLRLVANITGVPFGVLKDREAARQREKKMVTSVIAAVFAILALGAGIAGYLAIRETNRNSDLIESKLDELRSTLKALDSHDPKTLNSAVRKDILLTKLEDLEKVTSNSAVDDRLKIHLANVRRRVAESLSSVGQYSLALTQLDDWLAKSDNLPSEGSTRAELIANYLNTKTVILSDIGDPRAFEAATTQLLQAREAVKSFPDVDIIRRKLYLATYTYTDLGLQVEKLNNPDAWVSNVIGFDQEDLYGKILGNLRISRIYATYTINLMKRDRLDDAQHYAEKALDHAAVALNEDTSRSDVLAQVGVAHLNRAYLYTYIRECNLAAQDLAQAQSYFQSESIAITDPSLSEILSNQFNFVKLRYQAYC